MAVIYSDPFTYADGHLGVAQANWVLPFSEGFDVSSNTLVPQITGSDVANVWQGDVWPNDQYGQVAISGGATTDDDQSGVGVILRYADSSNFYRIVANGRASSNVTVAKLVTGTYTMLTQITQAFSAGDTLKVEVQGTTLRVYHNGTQIGSDVTDSSLSSGDVGMYYSSTAAGMSVDNFEGGDVSAGGTNATVTAVVATGTAAVVAPPKPRPSAPFAEINLRL